MDWYDVDDILLDGSKEEIQGLKCPDCGGTLRFEYDAYEDSDMGDLRVFCDACNQYEALHKLSGKPNCVVFFGKKEYVGDVLWIKKK